MMNRALTVVLLQLLIHLLVFLLFVVEPGFSYLPVRWASQFTALLSFSFVLSLIAFLFHSTVVHSIVLIMRTVVFLLIGFPLGSNISIEAVLIVSIFLDMHIHFPSSLAFILSILITLLSWYFQKPGQIWNVEQNSPSLSDQLIFIVFGFAANVFLFILSKYKLRLMKIESILGNYEISISNLMEANLRLQNNIITEITQAANKERKRIAQDLHDIIGHSMVNIMMVADSIKDKLDDRKGITASCDVIHEQASGALTETEKSMRVMKYQSDKGKYDISAIKKLISVFEKATGVEVVLEFRNAPTTFGEKVDRIIYRCIQEGLTNAFRHGKADQITILFWKYETREMEIIIKDNGKSTKNPNEGIGIWGIRERLAGIGGVVEVKHSEYGFTLILKFPLSIRSRKENELDDTIGNC